MRAMLASLARRCGVAHRAFWREDWRSFARTLSSSASDQESALQNAMLSSFQRWFEAYGGTTSGISMVQTPSIGWGLTASRDVDVGERLILLPRVLQMTYSLQDRESTSSSDQATAEQDREPDTPLYLKELIAQIPDELWSVRLGLALLHERALGGKSPFFQYISLLPAMHRGLPLFFGPEAVDALQYLPLVVQVKRRSRFLIDYSSGPLKDVTAGKDGKTESVPFDGYSVGADALGWAFACASSRAFRVAGEGKPAAMLPLIDVANHSFEASAEVRAAMGEGPGAIEMVASRPLRAGDEVTLNYGNLSNDHFLLDYGFVPQGINKHDTASLRWDVSYLEAAREVAGLAQVPFAAGTEPWQSAMLSELGLDDDPEVLVTRDERQPVDARLLAGIRVLYASGPEDFSSGGSGEALQPLRHGALLESTLDRTKEAYALRTAQAALALALGNFPTTLKEDETKLEELTAELAELSGVGDALEKENLALAVKFRKGKKEVISRAMKAIDERLRVVLAS